MTDVKGWRVDEGWRRDVLHHPTAWHGFFWHRILCPFSSSDHRVPTALQWWLHHKICRRREREEGFTVRAFLKKVYIFMGKGCSKTKSHLCRGLDRWVRRGAGDEGTAFLWLWGIRRLLSLPLPTVPSVAFPLPFRLFGSAAVVSPLLCEFNLRGEKIWGGGGGGQKGSQTQVLYHFEPSPRCYLDECVQSVCGWNRGRLEDFVDDVGLV